MTHAEYVAKHGREPHDEQYWGPGGVDVSKWGRECQRGLQYKQQEGVIQSSGPGQRRTFGGGRKTRTLASDAYDRLQSGS